MKMTRKRRRKYGRQRRQEAELGRAVRTGLGLAAAGVFFWNTMTPQPVQAMPTGAQVAAGAAAVSQNGNAMTVQQQTQNAVINWQSFNIAANERVQFLQPNAASAILNRVVGGSPSQIFGAMSANGRVFLVNPGGVLFAPGSQINVGSLVASTMNISNPDFMSGRFAFVNAGKDGKVINQGQIVAENKGLVAMLAPEVENSGVIVAKKGTVALAAGKEATLDFNGDGKVEVVPGSGALKAVVNNKGLVEADGGIVLMTAKAGEDLTSAVVNQDGIVRAQSLDGTAGKVTLQADNGIVNQTGSVDVTGQEGSGGSVDAFAQTVNITGTIDASGTQGGGTVRVGGDWQGSGDAPHAQNTTVSKTATIKADATENGNGGKIAVWSDGTTNFAGQISAKGAGNGDGGKVETSGHQLQVQGNVDASAANGKNGEWLMDPGDVTIAATGTDMSEAAYTGSSSEDSTISATSVSDALNKDTTVTIQTNKSDGNITVATGADIKKTSSGDSTLNLKAHQNIAVNGTIESTGGKLNVDLLSDSDGKSGGSINISSGTITTKGGSATLHGGKDGYANTETTGMDGIQLNSARITTDGGDITLQGSTSVANDKGVLITGTSNVDAGTAGKVTIQAQNGQAGNGLTMDTGSTITTKDAAVTADQMVLGGTITGQTTGTFTLGSLTRGTAISLNGSAGLNLDTTKVTGFGTDVIGDLNTAILTVAGASAMADNITLNAQTIAVDAALTAGAGASAKNITLNAGSAITEGTSGSVKADVLDVEASGKPVTLDNANNAVTTLQGKTGALTFKEADGFSTGVLTTTGDVSLTTVSGGITVADALTVGGKLTADAAGAFTIAADKTVSSTGAAITAGSLVTNTGSALNGKTGDITLQADSFTLPDNTVQGTGILTVDTKSKGNSFEIGTTATPASGKTVLSGTAFAKDGFKQVVLGSTEDTGALTVGTVTANDPLQVISGGNITVTGKVDGKGNQLDFVAGGTDGFAASSGTITNAAGNINITADKLAFGDSTFGSDDKGVLTLKTKTAKDITVGGTGSYLDDTGLGNIAKGQFTNVVMDNAANAIALAATSALPGYTTLKTTGSIAVNGTVTDTGTLALSGGAIIEGDKGLLNATNLLLLNGAVTLNQANTIGTVAASGVSSLTLNNAADLTVGSVMNQNKTTAAAVDGITATGAVKITEAADKKLTLAKDISAGGNVTLSVDDLAASGGKVSKASILQIFPTTTSKEIYVYGTGSEKSGVLNVASSILGGTYSKIILGELTTLQDTNDQTGNIAINSVTFPSEVEIRTKKDSNGANGAVTISGTDKIGAAGGSNLTITAHTASLPTATDTLAVRDLILNLDGGLALGNGKINGTGSLTVGGIGDDQNVYLVKNADASAITDTNAYKITYETVNNTLNGFSAFTVAGKKSVYLQTGSLTSSVTIDGATGVEVKGAVTVDDATGTTAAKTIVIGNNNATGAFTIDKGASLTVNSSSATVKSTPTGAAAINGTLDVESTGTAAVTLQGSSVSLGDAALVKIGDNATKAEVNVTGGSVSLGTDAQINLGSGTGNTFNLTTDQLTAVDDSTKNITGSGILNIKRQTASKALDINAAGSGTGLAIKTADLNGGIFDSSFGTLSIGNADGTGTITVDNVTFNNKLTLLNGSDGAVSLQGTNSVAENQAVTLKAGSIINNASGSSAGTLAVGTGGTVNLYTNSLADLKEKDTSTPAISGSGTLGLATYDGSKTIGLGDSAAGDLQLTNDKFTSVFGSGFSAYDIGNTAQGAINVSGSSLAKATTLTAKNINFTGNMTMTGTDSAAKTLTLDATTAAGQTGGIITADNLLLKDGKYTLEQANQIGTLAAKAQKVDVTETVGTMLTVGTVASTAGVTATDAGAIQLTTDQLTLTDALTGTGTLTIKQATAAGTMGIGTGATGDLQLTDSEFNGTKIKDGFSQINLGTTEGTVDIKGTPIFVDPTTIYGKTIAVAGNLSATGANSLELAGNTITTTSTSTIATTTGNLTLTADTMDLKGTSGGNISCGADQGGSLTIRTLTASRGIQLGTIDTSKTDTLNLPSSYFEEGDSRVFKDGYKLISLGRTDGTGMLTQSGTTAFTDPVKILQGSTTGNGAIFSGTINTNGNTFTVDSNKVQFTKATIDAGSGTVDIKTDSITTDSTSTIKSTGSLIIDTYTAGTNISLGDTTTTGLILQNNWFTGGTGSLFQAGYSSVTIGGTKNGGLTVGSLDLSKVTTGIVNLETTKNITTMTTTTGLTTNKSTTVNINDQIAGTPGSVTLSGANQITNLGNVKGSTITLNTTPAAGEKLNINGAVTGTEKILLDTTGSVNVGTTGSVTSTTGDIQLSAKGGSVTTDSMATDYIKADNGKWNIYTKDSIGNDLKNLTVSGQRYGTDYDTATADSYGKKVVTYAVQPTVTVFATKTYGDGYSIFFDDSGKAANLQKTFTVNGIAGEDAAITAARANRDGLGTTGGALETLKNTALSGASGTYSWTGGWATNSGKAVAVNADAASDGAVLRNGKNYYGTADGTIGMADTANPLNYKVNVQFVVLPKEVTVTANSGSKVYDGTTFSGGVAKNGANYTYTGFANGETAATAKGYAGEVAYTGTSQGARNVADGYTINLSTSNLSADNYTFKYVNGTLAITPRDITVSADGATRVYGSTTSSAAGGKVTAGSLVSGDTLGSLTYTSATINEKTNTGTYSVTPDTVTINDGNGGKNYNVTKVAGNIEVTKRPVYLIEDNKTRIYGEENSTAVYQNSKENTNHFTVAATDQDANTGLVNGDTIAKVTTEGNLTDTSITSASNVGTYTKAVGISDAVMGTGLASNYEFHYTEGNLVITPRPVDIKVINTTKFYGDANPTTTAIVEEAGKGTGLLNGDTLTDITTIYDSSINEKTHASTTPYDGIIRSEGGTFTGSSKENYTFNYGKGNILVRPLPITVTSDNAVKTYGSTTPITAAAKITSGSLVNGDALDSVTVTTNATETSPVGDGYTTTPSGLTLKAGGNGAASDYAVTYDSGSLKVMPRPVYLIEDNKTRIYGEENSTAVYQNSKENTNHFTVAATDQDANTGLVNGDTIAKVTTEGNLMDTSITSASNVGTYTAAIGLSDAVMGTGLASNYEFHYTNGALVITPRPVNVTVANTSKIYGEENPAATAAAATGAIGTGTGLLNGDLLTNIATAYDSAINARTHASATPYAGTITATGGDFTGSSKGNYTFNYIPGDITIQPRAITVTAGNASKVYGTDNPTVKTGTVTGLAAFDQLGDITTSVQADQTTAVGSYAATPTAFSLAAGSNAQTSDYAVTYVDGGLAITQRPVLLTADNASRKQGEANPAVSAQTGSVPGNSASGLIFGDQLTGLTSSYDSTLGIDTPVGIYKDKIKPDTLSGYQSWSFLGGSQTSSINNYSFLYAPGTLTIQESQPPTQKVMEARQDAGVDTVARMDNSSATTASAPQPLVSQAQPPVSAGAAGDQHVAVTTDGNTNITNFVDNAQGFGFTFEAKTGARDLGGRSSTNGAVPVLYTDGQSKNLDGIYTINYNNDKLAIEPSAQKTTIPEPKEIRNDITKDFTITYQSQDNGSYDVTFGNGIVTIYPVDPTALEVINSENRKSSKAVIATGVMTSIQDLGVMPDQIRAVYIFTTPEGAMAASTQH